MRAFYKWVVIPSYLSYHSVSLNSSSLKEWEIAPAFEEYRQRLRFDHWLMVPPLFSPVPPAAMIPLVALVCCSVINL